MIISPKKISEALSPPINRERCKKQEEPSLREKIPSLRERIKGDFFFARNWFSLKHEVLEGEKRKGEKKMEEKNKIKKKLT